MLRRFIPRLNHTVNLIRQVWTISESEDNICLKNDEEISSSAISFPYVWLRDNCQCPTCFHELSNSRTIHISEFNFDAVPKSTNVTDKLLEIEWNDNHKSTFSLPWLIERKFVSGAQHDWKKNVYKDDRVTWTSKEFLNIFKRFSFKRVLESDSELLSWLECLSIYGVAMIENAGDSEGKVKQLGERVSFLRRTQYGNTFRVEAKPDTTNVAYLNAPLQLHTDLPYCHYKPGVNLIHCIVQGEDGGDSQLSDCLAIANELKENNYSVYSILKSTNIVWSDKCVEDGRPYHSVHIGPVICENSSGEIERINFSQPQRDSQFNGSIEDAKAWYKAVKVFSEMMYSPDYSVFFRMKPGEILTFDNIRLVHGRVKYNGHRFMEGGYLDWDHIHSKIRVLRSKNN